MDEEMAQMVEEGFQVFAEKVLSPLPSLHKVIPVEKSIPVEVQVFPYEQASALMSNAKSFAVRRCICRVQKAFVGEPCKYPEEVCLVFAPIEGHFDDDPNARVVTKEEALKILRETEEAGLIHSSSNIKEGHYYICNCCTCCCGLLRAISEFGIPTAITHSDFHTVVDAETCLGCEDCVERCQFGALAVPDDVCEVDYARCVGCGVCVSACPADALRLERRPEGQTPPLPADNDEWMVWRAKERGIRLEQVL